MKQLERKQEKERLECQIHQQMLKEQESLMKELRTLPMWRKLNALVQDYLDGVTLADLTAEAQSADHYVI